MKRASFVALAVASLLAPLAAGCNGCSGTPSARLERVKTALVSDDASGVSSALEGLPACTASAEAGAAPSCLNELATLFGSKSAFTMRAPNQATLAAATVVLLRDHHGEWLVQPSEPGKPDLGAEVWLTVLAKGTGAGAEALRLAVARQMRLAGLARSFDSEADARALMKSVAENIPGACPTYAALGAGADDAKLPLPMMADHAPCVQRDLSRAGGPGGVYGAGLLRAAKGAVLLWKETADRLHQGCEAQMSGDAKARCLSDLAAVDQANAHLDVREMETPTNGALYNILAHADAGVDLDGGGARGVPRGDAGTSAAPVAPRR